jgi:hypothetical protein
MRSAGQAFHFDVIVRDALTTPLVQIVLRNWTPSDDGIALTPLMTAHEVDATVQLLKNELDAIASKAKVIAQ